MPASSLSDLASIESRPMLLFFDEEWRAVGRAVSYGHDIGASWPILEAVEILGDEGLRTRAARAAEKMARATLAVGERVDRLATRPG